MTTVVVFTSNIISTANVVVESVVADEILQVIPGVELVSTTNHNAIAGGGNGRIDIEGYVDGSDGIELNYTTGTRR